MKENISYISVNIVDQALYLIQAIRKHKCTRLQQVRELRFPYGIHWEPAIEFAFQCGWINSLGDIIELSQRGVAKEVMFQNDTISEPLWRDILADYIQQCHPVWEYRIPSGRKEAFYVMNVEEQRCFYEANLIDSYAPEVVEWWDMFANATRARGEESTTDIGRMGEKLSLAYEKKRTGKEPQWCAVDSNVSGYDILSVKSAVDSSKLLIEAKTSISELGEAKMYLTRNEWQEATQKYNCGCYSFHIWHVYKGIKKLAILDVDTMSQHIPQNKGIGKWESVSVPFTAFSKHFEDVSNMIND